MPLEKLAIICKLRELIRLDVMQRIRKRHLTEAMMMAVTLAVCRDVHQLRPLPRVRKAAHQAVGKTLAIVQQSFEGHALRNGPVIKKYGNRFSRWQLHEISAAWIHSVAADVLP